MKQSFAHILNKLWYVTAALIILAALLVSVSRLLTPVLNEHRADFEKIASNILNMPVLIHDVRVSWHGYEPEVSLADVTIIDPDTQTPKLVMQRLDVGFNIWRSIWNLKPFIETITVAGVDLVIQHSTEGWLQIGDLTNLNLKDTLTGAAVGSDQVFTWIFSQPRLALENIQLHYHAPTVQHDVTLKKLSLQNTATEHELDGQAVLNQALPTKVSVHLSWEGDVRQLPQAKAHLYLGMEALSLPQWFSQRTWHALTITQGLASAKLWMHWDHNSIQRVQSEFDFDGLTLYSSLAKHTEMINRLSGHVGWKRDGNTETWVGEKMIVDFPDHAWQTTDTVLTTTTNPTGHVAVNTIEFSYANLADITRIVLETDLLATDVRAIVTHVAPQGILSDVHVTLPVDAMDLRHWAVSGKAKQFSMGAYQQYPALQHLTGAIQWTGATGILTVNSPGLIITTANLFEHPLLFSHVNATVHANWNDKGDWTLTSQDLHVDNADAVADMKFVSTIPATGSPMLDLAATFHVMNPPHIGNYLPVKIMDTDLSTWLQNAFLAGQFTAGKAIITGKLTDFPFATTNSGKFLVTMGVNNVDLNYAPHWPILQHLNGQLTFAGSAMTIDIASGQLLQTPLQKVSAVIPYIGNDAPQILHVSSTLQSDLTTGLAFIQQSPLHKTIGNDLAALHLAGPMQLALNLVVPIKRPDDTTVIGDVVVTNGKLLLPAWRLALDRVNGSFRFTENSIESTTPLTSTLFGEAATLTMTTLRDTKQLRADLTSQISVPSLQQWLGLNLSSVATGVTPFSLQVYLSSHTAALSSDRVVLSSSLQGVTVKLPAPYGKAAANAKPLQVTLDLADSKWLKIKVSYASLLKAALTFDKSTDDLHFWGGELHLGDAMPAESTESGIFISGDVPQLDVDAWRSYFSALPGVKTADTAATIKLLRGINLHATTMDIVGMKLHQVHLNAVAKKTAWQMTVDSTEIGGDIMLPFELEGQRVEANLHHLYLVSDPTHAATKQLVDPTTLPAMTIESAEVRYNAMHFGHVTLQLEPITNGLEIKQLRMEEPSLHFSATGQWTRANKGHATHLQGEMSAPHIGDVLTEWGFNSANLVGSTGDIKFDLNWPNAPYAPAMSVLAGELSLKLGEGRIVHLSESTNSKMGLGRMLNILSLSTIPRRLSLNFSDLFEQGYSFDSMTSDFTFKNGNAMINDMRFAGPVAGVHLKGRIGIVAKDVDIQMGVSPHVTGSLPLVAAIAGGPVVGMATWLVDRMVSHEVVGSFTYEYSITGAWDNPVWKQVGSKPKPP